MTQPIGYLVEERGWRGVFVGWRQDLYDKLPWTDTVPREPPPKRNKINRAYDEMVLKHRRQNRI